MQISYHSTKHWNNTHGFPVLVPVSCWICCIVSRCMIVMSFGFDWGLIPCHASSVSTWDSSTLTRLCDLLVILMVTSFTWLSYFFILGIGSILQCYVFLVFTWRVLLLCVNSSFCRNVLNFCFSFQFFLIIPCSHGDQVLFRSGEGVLELTYFATSKCFLNKCLLCLFTWFHGDKKCLYCHPSLKQNHSCSYSTKDNNDFLCILMFSF